MQGTVEVVNAAHCTGRGHSASWVAAKREKAIQLCLPLSLMMLDARTDLQNQRKQRARPRSLPRSV